jgi:Family of unknown function (DUF6489)
VQSRRQRRKIEAAMKITMNVECTPEEARVFLGLPDVKPMQEEMLKEVQKRLSASLKAMDPEAIMKMWLPATLQGYEQLQEMFLSQMARFQNPKK